MDSTKKAKKPSSTVSTPSQLSWGSVSAGLITALSLLLPMGYYCGYAARASLLRGLGLDESLAPLDFNGYTRTGFESLYGMLGLALNQIPGEGVLRFILQTLATFAVMAIALFIYYRLSKRLRTKLHEGWHRSRSAISRASTGFQITLSMMLTGALFFLMPICLLFVAFYLLLPVLGASAVGRDEADKLWSQVREQNSNRKPRDFATFELSDTDGTRTAKLIECGETWCIAFDRDHFIALHPDEIKRIKGAKQKPSAT